MTARPNRYEGLDLQLALPAEVCTRRAISCEGAMIVTSGDRARWLTLRAEPWIGSSEVAAVLGEDPERSALEVYCRKLGLEVEDEGEADAEPAVVPEAMRWGSRMEPGVAFGYALETGAHLIDQGRWTLYRNARDPAFACTPDYFVEHPEWGFGVLEAKTAGAYRQREWREEPPLKFQIQVQHQLWTLGLRRGVLVVLLGGNRLWYQDVERNDEFCEAMAALVHDFLRRLAAREPPPPTGGARETAAVKALYPKSDPGEVVVLDDALRPTFEAWQQAAAREREARAERDALGNALKLAVRTAERGLFRDGHGLSWKTQERPAMRPDPAAPKVLTRVLRGVTPKV